MVTALDWRAVWFIPSIPCSRAFVDKHLNFRQVILWITSKDHSRAFVMISTGRNHDVVALATDVVQNLGV